MPGEEHLPVAAVVATVRAWDAMLAVTIVIGLMVATAQQQS